MKVVLFDVRIKQKLEAPDEEIFDHKSKFTEGEVRLKVQADDLEEPRFCRTSFNDKIFNHLAMFCRIDIGTDHKVHES